MDRRGVRRQERYGPATQRGEYLKPGYHGPQWRAVTLFTYPLLAVGRWPFLHPHAWPGRCRRANVVSDTQLILHTDGEVFFAGPTMITGG